MRNPSCCGSPAAGPGAPRDLCVVHGPGSFGRQVADGTEAIAHDLGIRTVRVTPDDQIPPPGMSADWGLFSAGVFEQDAELVGKVLRLPTPPRRVCAIAAGVREFSHAVEDPDGVLASPSGSLAARMKWRSAHQRTTFFAYAALGEACRIIPPRKPRQGR